MNDTRPDARDADDAKAAVGPPTDGFTDEVRADSAASGDHADASDDGQDARADEPSSIAEAAPAAEEPAE